MEGKFPVVLLFYVAAWVLHSHAAEERKNFSVRPGGDCNRNEECDYPEDFANSNKICVNTTMSSFCYKGKCTCMGCSLRLCLAKGPNYTCVTKDDKVKLQQSGEDCICKECDYMANDKAPCRKVKVEPDTGLGDGQPC